MPCNIEASIGFSDTTEVVLFPVEVRKGYIERTIWLSPEEFSHLLTMNDIPGKEVTMEKN